MKYPILASKKVGMSEIVSGKGFLLAYKITQFKQA